MQKRKMGRDDQVGGERWSEVSWGDLNHNNNTLFSCTRYFSPPIVAPLCGSIPVLGPRPSIHVTVDPLN